MGYAMQSESKEERQ